jgi:hypothetical protein
VFEAIQTSIPEEKMTHDKVIDGGCSKHRPDIFIDKLTHVVIVEIDENKHSGYDFACEIRRINELYTSVAFRPIVLIRVNPDKFEGESCFHSQNGFWHINENVFDTRMSILVETILEYTTSIPPDDTPLIEERLFYS